MAFEDVVWPMNLSINAEIGPEREVEIIESRGGREARNLPRFASRRRYKISVPADDHVAQDALLHFWEGRRGQHKSFPILDPTDHKSAGPGSAVSATDQVLGTGTGAAVAFQLVKVYESAGPNPYRRTILHPLTSTVVVSKNGTATAAGWSVSRETGIVTFATAVATGVVIRAGFHFHTTVRFAAIGLPATVLVGHSGDDDGSAVLEYRDVTLLEVLGE